MAVLQAGMREHGRMDGRITNGDHGPVLWTFWRDRHGAVAVEAALAISVAIVVLAGLITIMSNVFEADRMARAARAAALAAAIDPNADICAAAHRELGLLRPQHTADKPCGEWTLTLTTGLAADDLSTFMEGQTGASGTGEMVLVQIGWKPHSSESKVAFGVAFSE